MEKQRQSVTRGAAILAASNLLVKCLGVLFKVPLANLSGGSVLAYFNMAMSVFSFGMIAVTAGLPTALSRTVAASPASRRPGLARAAIIPAALFGAVSATVVYFSADSFAALAGNVAAAEAVRAAAPGIFSCCCVSALRAYAQGEGNMLPTALSQLTEAALRLGVGLFLAKFFAQKGTAVMAAGAIAGVSAGEICALLTLSPMLFRLRGAPAVRGCGRKLYLTALPLTVSSLVHSLAGIFDTRILISALRSVGYTARRATEVFGIYSGYCMTLFSFPPTLISALTSSVMPAAAERYAAKDRAGLSRLALRAYSIAAAICIPSAYAFMAMPRELLGLLFRREADVLLSAPLLAALAPGLVALGFSAVSRALLIACGKTNFTLFSGLIGCAVRLLVTALCVRMPEIGIFGAPLGSAAGMIASVIPEMIAVSHLGIGIGHTLRCALPPLFAGLPILLLAPLAHSALSGILPMRVSTIAAVCLFGLLVLALLILPKLLRYDTLGRKFDKLKNAENRPLFSIFNP